MPRRERDPPPAVMGWNAYDNSPYHTARTRRGFVSGIVRVYRRGEGPQLRLPTLPRSARMPATPPTTQRLEVSKKALVEKMSRMGYFERRFGWAASLHTMWDTDPTGSTNGITR
jgi:hypothetical protein